MYDYYGFFFLIFFLFFLFLFLTIIFSGGYTKREVAPGLTSQNYGVPTITRQQTSVENASFQSLQIRDGDATANNDALDFGGAVQAITLDFYPEYTDSTRVLRGYFKIFMCNSGTTRENLILRVVDRGEGTPSLTLSNYNIGWSSISLPPDVTTTTTYPVTVPFVTNSLASGRHQLEVQIVVIGQGNIGNDTIQVHNADIYYY